MRGAIGLRDEFREGRGRRAFRRTRLFEDVEIAAAGVTATSVYFEDDDLDATVGRLKAAGLAFDSDPVDQRWLWREAWLRDPSGNRVCLYRAGEARRFPPWRVD